MEFDLMPLQVLNSDLVCNKNSTNNWKPFGEIREAFFLFQMQNSKCKNSFANFEFFIHNFELIICVHNYLYFVRVIN